MVVSHGDTFNFGCVYAQEVLALRPDVACLSPKMLGHRWYRDRITARHPDLVLQEGGVALQLPEFVVANADRRPVYISVRIPLVAPEVVGIIPPTWPAAGTLLRVSGRGQFPPPPDVVEAALMRDWDGFVLRSSLVDEAELDEVLESTVWDHYGLVWTTLASGYAFSGEDAGRLRCEARARELSPWLLASRP